MKNIILCGGNGTRLWPISKENMPKQFLKMFDNKSLFQKTLQRNSSFTDKFIIVVNEKQFFTAQQQADEMDLLNECSFIIESETKNTAGAICLATIGLKKDDIVFVTPSDHLIQKDKNYDNVVKLAYETASKGSIVTFGIVPNRVETGYGYIRCNCADEEKIVDADGFYEKPDKKTAKKYLESNQSFIKFLWNSGMFMFKISSLMNDFKKYAPHILDACEQVYANSIKTDTMLKVKSMDIIPSISIDYAIMEKSKNIKVVKSDIKWNDIGSFDALDEVFDKDKNNNTKLDNLTVFNAINNFVFGKYKQIALFDVNDLIIVDTPSALLVGKKESSQDVKKIVDIIKKKDPKIIKYGRTVYKPWGKYIDLLEGEYFKVKSIIVNPGKRLSLQKHFHRSEHWVVVRGSALVLIGDKEFLLAPNQSTFVPIGEKHRLANPGKIALEIIEIQTGKYLQEDDIKRYDDDFGRIL